ncbi:MAG: hypothetical protein EXR91_12440 [Gemmatimonadetes bacterium]|nr:hypothetical protein [Gemmatimonadota bacterium]
MIREIVGIAAVVGSLLFVGLQVRQAAAATRGATQQQLSAAAREASIIMIDPDFAALLARAREAGDWSAFGPAEQVRLSAYYRVSFRVYEDAHYQFRLGNLAPELWAGFKGGLTLFLEIGGERDYWSQDQARFNAPFRALVDSIRAAR